MSFVNNYLDNNLDAGEKLLRRPKQHWITMLWPFTFFLMTLSSFVTASPALAIAVFLPLTAWSYYTVKSFEYGITDSRVIVKRGIISRQVNEQRLSKIESVSMSQSIAGRILGFSSLTVVGTGGMETTMVAVENARDVKVFLDTLIK